MYSAFKDVIFYIKQLNRPPKTFITTNYFKIKYFVPCILAKFMFQISLLRTLEA